MAVSQFRQCSVIASRYKRSNTVIDQVGVQLSYGGKTRSLPLTGLQVTPPPVKEILSRCTVRSKPALAVNLNDRRTFFKCQTLPVDQPLPHDAVKSPKARHLMALRLRR